MEWVPFLTVKLVDDFAAHLKLFGLALEHCKKHKDEGNMFSYFLEQYWLMSSNVDSKTLTVTFTSYV